VTVRQVRWRPSSDANAINQNQKDPAHKCCTWLSVRSSPTIAPRRKRKLEETADEQHHRAQLRSDPAALQFPGAPPGCTMVNTPVTAAKMH